jgi:hypothetical protein
MSLENRARSIIDGLKDAARMAICVNHHDDHHVRKCASASIDPKVPSVYEASCTKCGRQWVEKVHDSFLHIIEGKPQPVIEVQPR